MTDGFDQALVSAGLALLAADVGPPPLLAFDGVVPAGTDPDRGYVLVYVTVGWPVGGLGDSLDGNARTPIVRFLTHSISTTAAGARGVHQRVRTQLLNKRLVVAGLNCGLIRMEGDVRPPTRDEITGIPVVDVPATFRTFATT